MRLYRKSHSANLTPLFQSIILSFVLLVGCRYAESERAPDALSEAHIDFDERIRAVTLDAREVPADSVLLAIKALGATHIALVSFGFQQAADDPDIRFSPEVRWYSESADGIRDIARRADGLGMGVILKPQLWVRGGVWSADIALSSGELWERWESNYRELLLYTAQLAEEVDADLLVIGTELGGAVRARPHFWRQLAADVRAVYGGKLTYAANWHADYDRVTFWDAMDFVGVQAYFPISAASNPSLDDLRTGWSAHVKALEKVAGEVGRPILFTEIGYRSISYAAMEPWRWPERGEPGEPDDALQARLFQAFFDTVWDRPWFAGAVIWKFHPPRSRRRLSQALDFTPQGKPAETVIRQGFAR